MGNALFVQLYYVVLSLFGTITKDDPGCLTEVDGNKLVVYISGCCPTLCLRLEQQRNADVSHTLQ